MEDCLFCKILTGEIPSEKVYEDDYVLAFHDVYPKAPFHVLIITKEHIVSAADITSENSQLIAKCFEAVAKIAKKEGLENGFRVITNSGPDGNQTVFHLHFHLLGGEGASLDSDWILNAPDQLSLR